MEPNAKYPGKFLVVDDDEAFRTRLIKALQSRGLQAQGAGSGDEALKVATTFAPAAAIIDLRMPGMSGLIGCEPVAKTSLWQHRHCRRGGSSRRDQLSDQAARCGSDSRRIRASGRAARGSSQHSFSGSS